MPRSRRRRGSATAALCRWLLCLTLPAIFGAKAQDTLQLEQPTPGVFVHFGKQLALDAPGHDDIANIGFIVGAKCVAVIDTGGSVRTGRALLAALRRHTQLPVCYVINTHVHVDHLLGNAAFRQEKPSYVAHAALPAALARSRELFLTQYAADLDAPATADQLIGPDRLVTDTLELDLGDRKLLLRAWPKAHTDCDLTVYDERSDTLWTGDLLFRERLPAVDGSIKGWLVALTQLATLKPHFVVPGHGPLAKDIVAAVQPERRYLQALEDGVRAALKKGQSMPEAMDTVAASEKPHWLLWEQGHKHNVARVYEELEWE